jgi:L-alanine-DL-glutamate epimerase-like enolase superfamily enzyme
MNRKRDVYYWQERSILKNIDEEWKEHIVFKIIDKDGYEGSGAATPDENYGETFKTAMAVVEGLRKLAENYNDLGFISDFQQEMDNFVKYDKTAKTAVFLAICDYISNKKDIDITKALFPVKSGYSKELLRFYWKKDIDITPFINKKDFYGIKVEFLEKPENDDLINILSSNEDANFWFDFRGSLNHFELRNIEGILNNYNNVIALEQPLPVFKEFNLNNIKRKYPIFWDESLQRVEDILRLKDCGTGFVFDITKFGGILNIYQALSIAKSYGLETVLSTRLEHPLNVVWSEKIKNSFDVSDLNISHYIEKTSK